MPANDKNAIKQTCTINMWLLWFVKIHVPSFVPNAYIAATY